MSKLSYGPLRYRPPFDLTDDGDIDVLEKRICNLGAPKSYDDAISVRECINAIDQYNQRYKVLECEGEPHNTTYNINNSRLINVAYPREDNDAVNFKFLLSHVKRKVDDHNKELTAQFDEIKTKISHLLDRVEQGFVKDTTN